jgi:ABC-2 type transport system permease protein
MREMKFLSIAIKDLKEILRDRRGFFFILLFPILFMLVFGFAFSSGDQNTPHNIAIINYDQGSVLNNQSVNFGNNLTQLLVNAKYSNSNISLFNVTQLSESAADQQLKQRKIDAELIIPQNFSQASVSLVNYTALSTINPLASSPSNTSNITSSLIIRGDPSYINFGTTQGILVGILSQYKDQLVINTQDNVRGTPGAQPTQYLSSTVQAIPGTTNFTTFDFLAPGMIVFAIILLATTVAASLTREVEKGTLARLKLSKMRGFDLLFGGLLPWSLIVVAQVIILLAVAIAIGFHYQGGVNSILLAILVGVIGGIASISLAMIIASFAKNDRQAANLGTVITVPLSFLAGAFFPLPQEVIGNFMGQSFQIYNLIPWYNTITAMRNILTYGGGWSDISYQVGLSVLLTIILFVIGVALFTRTRLGAES